MKLVISDYIGIGIDMPATADEDDGSSDVSVEYVSRTKLSNNRYEYHLELSDDTLGADAYMRTYEKNGDVYVEGVKFVDNGHMTIELSDFHLAIDDFDFDYTKLLGGNDTVSGNKYQDLIRGFGGNDTLNGLGGNDRLIGGSGNDALSGGWGKDTLTGNTGTDRFIFNDGDTGLGKSGRDIITDFKAGQDRINLQLVDANSHKSGDQAFEFGGSHAGKNDVWFTRSGNDLVVHGDNTGDGKSDFEILLTGVHSLKEADFLL